MLDNGQKKSSEITMVSVQSNREKEILRMVESDVTTMTYVFDVKTSMKAAKFEFLTSIDWNCAANLLWFKKNESESSAFHSGNGSYNRAYLQLSLNCLIILDTFSKR